MNRCCIVVCFSQVSLWINIKHDLMFFVLSIQLDATLYLKNMKKRFFFFTNKSSVFIFFNTFFIRENHVNYFQSWMLENTWRIISPKIKKNMMERVSWFWYHDQSIWLLNCFKEGKKDAWRGICWHLNFPSNAKKKPHVEMTTNIVSG